MEQRKIMINRKPKKAEEKTLKLVREVPRHKINIQQSTLFLYITNNQSEKITEKTISFTAQQNIENI